MIGIDYNINILEMPLEIRGGRENLPPADASSGA